MQFGRILGPLQAVAGAFLKLGKSIYLHPRLGQPLQGARAGTFWALLGANPSNLKELNRM